VLVAEVDGAAGGITYLRAVSGSSRWVVWRLTTGGGVTASGHAVDREGHAAAITAGWLGDGVVVLGTAIGDVVVFLVAPALASGGAGAGGGTTVLPCRRDSGFVTGLARSRLAPGRSLLWVTYASGAVASMPWEGVVAAATATATTAPLVVAFSNWALPGQSRLHAALPVPPGTQPVWAALTGEDAIGAAALAGAAPRRWRGGVDDDDDDNDDGDDAPTTTTATTAGRPAGPVEAPVMLLSLGAHPALCLYSGDAGAVPPPSLGALAAAVAGSVGVVVGAAVRSLGRSVADLLPTPVGSRLKTVGRAWLG